MASKTMSNGRSRCSMGAWGLANRWLNTRRDILYNILYGGFGFTRGQKLIWHCVICWKILILVEFAMKLKTVGYILVWLARWGSSLPGQLRYPYESQQVPGGRGGVAVEIRHVVKFFYTRWTLRRSTHTYRVLNTKVSNPVHYWCARPASPAFGERSKILLFCAKVLRKSRLSEPPPACACFIKTLLQLPKISLIL
jgi:hypothetical protein